MNFHAFAKTEICGTKFTVGIRIDRQLSLNALLVKPLFDNVKMVFVYD